MVKENERVVLDGWKEGTKEKVCSWRRKVVVREKRGYPAERSSSLEGERRNDSVERNNILSRAERSNNLVKRSKFLAKRSSNDTAVGKSSS